MSRPELLKNGASRSFWTVWDLRSVDGKQKVRVVRPAHTGDTEYAHEYQRVVGQVLAFTAAEALALVNSQDAAA